MISETHRKLVEDNLKKHNITGYTISEGNECVWVNYHRRGFSMNDYYIIRDDKIVDIISD